MANAKEQFDTIILVNKCDAVMSFFETDFIESGQAVDNYYIFSPDMFVHVKVKHLRFNQDFNIRLYEPGKLLQSFWGSALNIDYDFRDPGPYHTISDKLLTSLKRNTLCN